MRLISMNLSQQTLEDLNELYNLTEDICELSKLNWCSDNRMSETMYEHLKNRHDMLLRLGEMVYCYYMTCVR